MRQFLQFLSYQGETILEIEQRRNDHANLWLHNGANSYKFTISTALAQQLMEELNHENITKE